MPQMAGNTNTSGPVSASDTGLGQASNKKPHPTVPNGVSI